MTENVRVVQGTKELIASIFKLQTEVTRLKNDVQKLGSGRDTVELRQKVGAAIQRIQSNAQAIKDKLMKLHNDSKTPQTTKIVNDFEVRMMNSLSWRGVSGQLPASS